MNYLSTPKLNAIKNKLDDITSISTRVSSMERQTDDLLYRTKSRRNIKFWSNERLNRWRTNRVSNVVFKSV